MLESATRRAPVQEAHTVQAGIRSVARVLALFACACACALAMAPGAHATAPQLLVSESGGTTDLAEPVSTDTYTIRLSTAPTANVVVDLVDDGQMTASPSSVTFTTSNWNLPRTITVSVVDDGWVEGLHAGMIAHILTSTDPQYDALAAPDLFANITDDDAVGVLVSESGSSTDVVEGGATDSFTVRLQSEPTDIVTVDLVPDGGLYASPLQLNFDDTNWDQPQTVTVTAVNDSISTGDRTLPVDFVVSSADWGYDGWWVDPVQVNVTEDDQAQLLVSESAGSTDVVEGGATDDVLVSLSAQPLDDVVVDLAPDSSLALPGVTQLVFTPANWYMQQSVTVAAFDDTNVQGPHTGNLSFSVSSNDPAWNWLSVPDVVANVTDDDHAGIAWSGPAGPGPVSVSEAGTCATVTVSLSSQPSGTVTVHLTGDGQVTASPGAFALDVSSWNNGEPVQVCAVDDSVAEGSHFGHVSFSTTSADPGYDGISVADVTATIADNDFAGLDVAESGGTTSVVEGSTGDTLQVKLDSQPTSDVTVQVLGDALVSVTPATLTFTASNWSTTQAVIATTANDGIPNGIRSGTIQLLTSSTDPDYATLTHTITAQVVDDDVAGVEIQETNGSTDVAEGGLDDTYQIRLTAQPTQTVTVMPVVGTQTTVAPASVSFGSADWNQWKSVDIGAVDDLVMEGPHSEDVTHTVSTTDPVFASAVTPTLHVNITDNEIGGITAAHTGGGTVVAESGATDTITVRLALAPPAGSSVTVAIAGEHLVATPSTVTFDDSNLWSTARTITISAPGDEIDQGTQYTSQLTFTAHSTTAPLYEGVTGAPLSVTITDDDVANAKFEATGGGTSVTEGGDTDTVRLRLLSRPSEPVVMVPNPGDQLTVTPARMTIDPADWDKVHEFTVKAIDDKKVEGDHTGRITIHLTSDDTNYNTMDVDALMVNITDNDKAAVTDNVGVDPGKGGGGGGGGGGSDGSSSDSSGSGGGSSGSSGSSGSDGSSGSSSLPGSTDIGSGSGTGSSTASSGTTSGSQSTSQQVATDASGATRAATHAAGDRGVTKTVASRDAATHTGGDAGGGGHKQEGGKGVLAQARAQLPGPVANNLGTVGIATGAGLSLLGLLALAGRETGLAAAGVGKHAAARVAGRAASRAVSADAIQGRRAAQKAAGQKAAVDRAGRRDLQRSAGQQRRLDVADQKARQRQAKLDRKAVETERKLQQKQRATEQRAAGKQRQQAQAEQRKAQRAQRKQLERERQARRRNGR